ncbi:MULTISPECIES: glycosyltransferase family 2 protein [unclassified Ensifer]|uniref:glycosyltransferase family 2 protein n=1 Tax=unclassified Ensifer TaxID=2633371 RepID=UPI0030104D55
MRNDITIAAIAKNEARYLSEWIAYHLAIGVSRILVYSNDTEDLQEEFLERISRSDQRIAWIRWPSREGISPQVSAYQDALDKASTEWISFIDIDEFIVPLAANTLPAWLMTVPDDVSTVHINWAGFGSGGRQSADYPLVTRAFSAAALRDWDNNRHFKSIGRRTRVTRVAVHNIVADGRRCLSDFSDFETLVDGASLRVCHDGIQINHYQCKTFAEFRLRMRRGDANVPIGHPGKPRDDSFSRFAQLDQNQCVDTAIRRFDAVVDRELRRQIMTPHHPYFFAYSAAERIFDQWQTRRSVTTPDFQSLR